MAKRRARTKTSCCPPTVRTTADTDRCDTTEVKDATAAYEEARQNWSSACQSTQTAAAALDDAQAAYDAALAAEQAAKLAVDDAKTALDAAHDDQWAL